MQNQIVTRAYEGHLIDRCITDNVQYLVNADRINEYLFITTEPKRLFKAFQKVIQDGNVTDQAMMMSVIDEKLIDYMIDCSIKQDYSIPIDQLINQLEEQRKQYEFIKLAAEIAQMKGKPSSEIQQHISTRFMNIGSGSDSQYRSISEIVTQVKVDIEKMRKGKMTGVVTGFYELDRHMKGLQNGDLIIIAGETSQGKTSFALNIAENAYRKAGKKGAIISMEMTESQLAMRLVCSMAEVSRNNVISGWATDEEKQHYEKNMDDLSNSGIFIADPSSRNIENIVALIRSAFMRFKLDFVIIDYLQLIVYSGGRNREEEIGKIARSLKDIARELDKPVIALSQLNRAQQGTTKAPNLSRLRDSGQIEEAADVVIFVHRPEEYGVRVFDDGTSSEGMAEMIMAKGRNYGTMSCKLIFRKEITKFEDEIH